jgi:gamma-glutamyltranspeptidase/glutathione hydrolase
LRSESSRLRADPGLAEVFLRDGEPLTDGDLLQQPALAASLTMLRDKGVQAFYRGPLGASVTATLRAAGSSLDVEDLAAHRPVVTDPVGSSFRGEEYLSTPPNSQGAYFLAGLRAVEILEQRAGRPLEQLGADAGVLAQVLHRLAEHRDRLLSDPADAMSLVDALLSEREAQALADAASTGWTPADPPAWQPDVSARPSHLSGDTVAVTVGDAEGHWVSLNQSVFHSFGSGILDPATGIVLHNRGGSFSLAPGSPNRLGPRRRPLHTLMPVLARRDGRVIAAHGTMGGRAQPQIHTHLAIGVGASADPSAAVAAPRWVLGQMEAGPDNDAVAATVSVEEGTDEAAVRSLRAAGFTTTTLPDHDDGAGHAQLVRQVGGVLVAASDPRADGRALAG